VTDLPILLQLDSVTKVFPGVRALDQVTLSIIAGEVHGLIGENGAGKSTLMAIAAGALVPEEGRVFIGGVEAMGDTERARSLGLAIVRQEPALMPDLTVAENLYLGVPEAERPSLMSLSGWVERLLTQWSDDVAIDPSTRVLSLNPEQRFIVEIVKALAAKPKVLVLDEPTEHLLGEDVERLFERIRKITASGCAVVYISHRIREVQQIANRLTVLRDGQGQGTYEAAGLSEHQIIELIVGHALDREFPPKSADVESDIVFDVEGLSGRGFSNVSLRLKKGEIVGLAGIDGNGQREFMRALAGLNPTHGWATLNGQAVSLKNSKVCTQAGIVFLPGDRHLEGIFAGLSVRENFSIRSLGQDAVGGLVSKRSEARRSELAVKEYTVKTPSIETDVASLSGGNQQKLLLASVLANRPKVILIDEPTQGVDVGARSEIYKLLREAASQGAAILVLSSDAAEVEGLSDRVMIFSRGHIVKELRFGDVTESNITTAMLTASTQRERGFDRVGKFWKWAAGDWAPILILAVIVCALGLYASHVNEAYLSARNLSGVLALVATLAIVSYGQQVLMLAGGIDLSVGPLMGIVVVIFSFYLTDGATVASEVTGWTIAVLVALGIGLLNWFLVDPLRLHPMVATLATFMGLQAVALILRPIPGGLIAETTIDRISTTEGFVPVAVIVALVVAAVLEFVLHKTKFGISLRGLGSRREAARMAGIRPNRMLLIAYVSCSLLSAAAGILLMAQIGNGDANAGKNYTLSSIAAAVIGGASLFGGRGSFVGGLLGALLLTQINVVTTFLNLDDSWQSVLLGAVILASVTLYSTSRRMVVAN
jgi:ribose transport system ATP-binding protein